MKEFIDKLIEILEEYKYSHLVEHDVERLEHCKENEEECEGSDCFFCLWDKAIQIINELAEEYINTSTEYINTSIKNIDCSIDTSAWKHNIEVRFNRVE